MPEARISARVAAIAESATLAVDAKAKALKAAGEPGHRLRRRRARLPDARATSSRPPSRPAATRRTTATRPAGGLPELKEAIAAKTLRDSGYEVQGQPGARSPTAASTPCTTRCSPCSTRVTRSCCRRRTGRPTPSRSASPAACPSVIRPTRRPASGSPSTSSRPPARRAPRRSCSCRRRTRPAPCTPRPRSGPSASGPPSTASGSITDEIYEHLTYGDHLFTSMPTLVPELADTLRRAQRRGQDLRHDRLAGRVDDRPDRRHQGRRPTSSPTPRRTSPTSPSGPRSPRSPATSAPSR